MSWISGLRAIRGVFSVGWIHFADVTPEQFRARFPILRQRVYVNSCSQGALSVDVEEALAAFVQSWHEHGSPWDRWVADVERLRTAFAALVGADADEIAVMPSASSAIAAIATALNFDGAKPSRTSGWPKSAAAPQSRGRMRWTTPCRSPPTLRASIRKH
jgi:hypothetical protein